jgi:hypothetical protein
MIMLLPLFFFGVVVLLVYWGRKEAVLIHQKLDEFEHRAYAIDVSRSGLYILKEEVVNFARQYCVVKPYGRRACEILNFINGRIAGCKD